MSRFKNLFSTILCLTMLLFMVPTMVRAEEIDSKEFITLIPYQGLGEVFDYTYENGEVVLKVKDIDLYNELVLVDKTWQESINGSDSKTDTLIREGTPLYNKLSKYLKEIPIEGEDRTEVQGTLGLHPHIYFPDNVTKISFLLYNQDGEEEDNGVFDLNGGINIKQDENGKYYYDSDRAGVLFDAWYDSVDGKTTVVWTPLQKSGSWDYNWGYTYKFVGLDANGNEVFTSKIRFSYELGDSSVVDENNGVSVTGKKNMDTTLTVEKLDTKADVYKELVEKLEGKKVLGAFEVKLNGAYEGKLSVSFNVDSKYNGQKATVLHKKSDGTVETFEKVITDGKVTVEVDELSPFVIALSDVKADGTPILGVPSYVGLASLLVLCASVCLIKVLKKD